MATLETTQFGLLNYDEQDVFQFPAGLPGFEHQTEFLMVEREDLAPLVFLQSTALGSLRFVCAPVRLVDPAYTVRLNEPELDALRLSVDDLKGEGSQAGLLGLAILSFHRSGPPTANLQAPVVLSRCSRRGLQSIQPSPHDVAQPLRLVACSASATSEAT